jgi:hypothetical protein
MAKRFLWVASDDLINLGVNDRAVIKSGFGRHMLKAEQPVL